MEKTKEKEGIGDDVERVHVEGILLYAKGGVGVVCNTGCMVVNIRVERSKAEMEGGWW